MIISFKSSSFNCQLIKIGFDKTELLVFADDNLKVFIKMRFSIM